MNGTIDPPSDQELPQGLPVPVFQKYRQEEGYILTEIKIWQCDNIAGQLLQAVSQYSGIFAPFPDNGHYIRAAKQGI